jgi:hypothetical protein
VVRGEGVAARLLVMSDDEAATKADHERGQGRR